MDNRKPSNEDAIYDIKNTVYALQRSWV